MKIKKANFILRPWMEGDCASLAEQANNKAIWNNVRDSFPHPYTENDAQDFIQMVTRKPFALDFAIEIEGKAAGGVGFVPGQDIEQSFISAETIAYADLVACGSFAKARELGKLRTEGKEYVVEDGDVMEFKTFL